MHVYVISHIDLYTYEVYNLRVYCKTDPFESFICVYHRIYIGGILNFLMAHLENSYLFLMMPILQDLDDDESNSQFVIYVRAA